ncbi:MAG: hypothetical protein ABEN55_05395 [Bradymonadaceae bacterium]
MTSETIEELEQIFDGDWDEQAPLAGPPTFWAVREKWGDGNMMLSINFSPMKDTTGAKFNYKGNDFTFTGEVDVEGFAPADALEKLIAIFDQELADPLMERVLG